MNRKWIPLNIEDDSPTLRNATPNTILGVLEDENLKKIEDNLPPKSPISIEQQITEINSIYGKGVLVLILGAGISKNYNLPDWNTLIQKLLLKNIKSQTEETEERSKVLAKIFVNLFPTSPLVAARYLYNSFCKDDNHDLKFEKLIRDTIYADINKDKESNLFHEISQFCIATRDNLNLDSIITYNFDDLLESYLNKIGIDCFFQPIYATGMNPEPNKLPIYHVHGYLPQNDEISIKNQITLSENYYHQQYTDVYHWSNLVQINKFKENNCLFIGLSFSDPNLRRLLDISRILRGDCNIHHYCFKEKYSMDRISDALENLLKTNSEIQIEKDKAKLNFRETVTKLISIMENYEEQDAKSFGVSIIWLNDYEEIPNILKQIRRNNSNSQRQSPT